MILTLDFLCKHPEFLETNKDFFLKQLEVATHDLALAHSITKVGCARNTLKKSHNQKHRDLANTNFIAGHSIKKPSDTLNVSYEAGKYILNGEKQWITNLDISNFCNIGLDLNGAVYNVYINLSNESLEIDMTVLPGPGMLDSRTGKITFINYTLTDNDILNKVAYDELSEKWAICCPQSGHNNLFFSTNMLGASMGLLKHLADSTLHSRAHSLHDLWQLYIDNLHNNEDVNDFYNKRNNFYTQTKCLLVDTLNLIIQTQTGKFFDPRTDIGKLFYDSLIFSAHNGRLSKYHN